MTCGFEVLSPFKLSASSTSYLRSNQLGKILLNQDKNYAFIMKTPLKNVKKKSASEMTFTPHRCTYASRVFKSISHHPLWYRKPSSMVSIMKLLRLIKTFYRDFTSRNDSNSLKTLKKFAKWTFQTKNVCYNLLIFQLIESLNQIQRICWPISRVDWWRWE